MSRGREGVISKEYKGEENTEFHDIIKLFKIYRVVNWQMQIKINQVSVMLSLMYQANHRSSNYWLRKETNIFSVLFSLFMICGRLLYGVHWCTDIIGGVLLSFGLFGIYRGATLLCCRNQWQIGEKTGRETYAIAVGVLFLIIKRIILCIVWKTNKVL